MVDLYNYRKANTGKPTPPLLYWGKYVAHDNNRDGLGLALALTRNQMRTFLDVSPDRAARSARVSAVSSTR
jgi:hypothetical protein